MTTSVPVSKWASVPHNVGMGIIRKTMSISTVGIVPYRNKDERAAKTAKQTRNAARLAAAAGVVAARQQGKMLKAQQAAAAAPAPSVPMLPSGPVPPQWLPDPYNPNIVTWWDGQQWRPEQGHHPR